MPGKTIVRFPSKLQNIVGSGLPVDVQVNVADEPLSTVTVVGCKLIDGGSKKKKGLLKPQVV